MKKILPFMLACMILCTLSACNDGPSTSADAKISEAAAEETTQATEAERAFSTARSVRYEEGSSYGVHFVIEGPAPVNNKYGNHFYPAEDPVLLADNDVLKAVLIGTFEQEYGAEDDRKQGRGAAVEFTNQSDRDLLISMKNAVIDNKVYQISNLGCPDQCAPGETIQINFIIYTRSDSKESPIESMEDVYKLRADINVLRFVDADNVTDSEDFPFLATGDLALDAEPTVPRVKREYEKLNISPNVEIVVKLDEPILLLENEYVKMEITEFYQERVNWADEKGSRIEMGITVKTTNQHDKKLSVDLKDLYIGDKQIKVCMQDGSIMPVAGKSVYNGFLIWDHQGHEDMNLQDINELFALEGRIRVREYAEEHRTEDLGEYPFYVS